MDAEHLEFPNNSFDYVVTTFVLCTIPDPAKALKEMRRVLKPSGKLVALEHIRSSNPFIVKFEELIDPFLFSSWRPYNPEYAEEYRRSRIYYSGSKKSGF
nr:class I SAM-dependent methyltransferase [Methanosarcina sp. DH2]